MAGASAPIKQKVTAAMKSTTTGTLPRSDSTCGGDELNCSFFNLAKNLSNNDNIPGPEVRPVQDWRRPTTVYIDLSLYTVVSLDTSLQSLVTYIWFSMEWENEFIKWEPEDFCKIKNMVIPGEKFWQPDLYIYEMIENEDKSPVISYFLIHSNGLILDTKPIRIVSACDLNVFKFPFDKQTCNLTFGSYLHSVKDIIMLPKLNSSQVNINTRKVFVSKGDWSLLDISVSNTTYWTGGQEFSKVIFQINIKRSSVVYVINLIIPACFLVIMDIVSMFIHIGTGERLGFKITVVLGFSVLLLILNDMLPSSDTPAVLGIFCCVCLAVMVFSTIGSVATSYMLMLSESQPSAPAWIQMWIMRRLARVLFFKVKSPKTDMVSIKDATSDGKKDENVPDLLEKKVLQKEKDSLEVKLLKRLLFEILQIHKELTLSRDTTDTKSDWCIAAMIVDRLVFILYLLIVIVMFAVVICVWVT
ncbi:5-hydroxytryptamine receptor 3A-like [Bufo bufo]|uniref:5-hydroxytryptamine receptor 3A-like n=1 Tax=Bufo bufo TaxID=8384 RepID=UPI001ABEA109|nr:5-hydroxytryptamine receptor 3A-like [Bufo bufo]